MDAIFVENSDPWRRMRFSAEMRYIRLTLLATGRRVKCNSNPMEGERGRSGPLGEQWAIGRLSDMGLSHPGGNAKPRRSSALKTR